MISYCSYAKEEKRPVCPRFRFPVSVSASVPVSDSRFPIEEKRAGAEEGTRTSEFRQFIQPQENSDIY
jgi:hypothetical protein